MKSVIKFFKQINRIFMKQNIWTKTAISMGIILIILIIVNRSAPCNQEGFTQREKFVLKEGNAIYDDFYCSIYDELVYDNVKNDFEVGELKRLIKPTSQSRVLDLSLIHI